MASLKGIGTVTAIGILLEAAIILFSVAVDGFTLEALHTTTRYSGRLSLLAFSLILLLYDKRGVIRIDRAFFIFALLHGIHLIELLFYVRISGVELIPLRVFGGFIAYAMIFAMPVIVLKKDRGELSVKNFNRIETVYFSYVWLIFFLTYLPRVMGTLPNVGGTFMEHVILFSWVILLGVIKMVSVIGAKMQL
ncbi:MAG: hypothetical protein HY015_06700 [Bacteroidetes bacterium]|nr:hypothetical protein [Bacteroidota bacterium]MBI3482653.1 hypothetical protein [Bacteroidota bacterium]